MNRKELAIVFLFLALAIILTALLVSAGAVEFVGEMRSRFN
jgi:hypothetical protein